ncbi:germacrene-D synthase-like isoform X1 [Sesamum indicum]|uniref:Germacrene-D synthase-like isoform X1 n=1 Tax=Sesamum indicum TaxID=4182 RepID=A0A6I9U569_SESIN|nr:germacrene-D synthase-like isoform X1 [Sesamum indicum]
MEFGSSNFPIFTKNDDLDDVRRSVKFHPTIWGEYFLAYASTEISSVEKDELQKQKKMMRKVLNQTPDDSSHKLELIDAIQRLGVSYHFEEEIGKSLKCIYDIYSECSNKDNNVRSVALRFRLLRQQGYAISPDVFSKFTDKEGNFNEMMFENVEDLLDLYEAAHFGVDGDEILDKALEFSSSKLQFLLPIMTTSLSKQVKEALKIPILKSLTRLGAWKFIAAYQQHKSHNEILLNFAKLDFNIVQKMHQKELSLITRWWKDLNFTNKLSFARDRVAECYFWILGVYFEPQYQFERRILTKVLALISIMDDIYDIYGTLEDLQLFTRIVQRWDVNDLDQLPPYMGICYKAFLDVYLEMEAEVENGGESYLVQYTKEEMKKLTRAFLQEAEWVYSKYMPTMEEYTEVALVTTGHAMMATLSLIGVRNTVTKKDLEWITSKPLIVQASAIVCRFMDDIVGFGIEKKYTAVHCYMNQNGASKMDTFAQLREQVKKAWKDMNQECLEPTPVSMSILKPVVDLARVIHLLYADNDDYTNSQTNTRDYISCVLVEPLTT